MHFKHISIVYAIPTDQTKELSECSLCKSRITFAFCLEKMDFIEQKITLWVVLSRQLKSQSFSFFFYKFFIIIIECLSIYAFFLFIHYYYYYFLCYVMFYVIYSITIIILQIFLHQHIIGTKKRKINLYTFSGFIIYFCCYTAHACQHHNLHICLMLFHEINI